MIMGRAQPELGGRDDLIDVIGVNYYIHNQFVWEGHMIVPSDSRYRDNRHARSPECRPTRRRRPPR